MAREICQWFICDIKKIFSNANKKENEMLVYTKLWLLLKERGMKKTDLLEVISSATLAKLGKNENVSTEVLARICDFLKCQPADIMENITKEDIIEINTKLSEQMMQMLEQLETLTGQTKEELLDEFLKEAPTFIEKMKCGDLDISETNES